ncbi:hypothetical protein D3C72_2217720 [compost metagenome]
MVEVTLSNNASTYKLPPMIITALQIIPCAMALSRARMDQAVIKMRASEQMPISLTASDLLRHRLPNLLSANGSCWQFLAVPLAFS